MPINTQIEPELSLYAAEVPSSPGITCISLIKSAIMAFESTGEPAPLTASY
jgi:hypothetical protein